ncbi:MAG: DUF1080 domain-containing protein [Verrucomicrobiaceae bacterium]|nr:MAG: DUF1080 domain-containing protein [Verrucomicrobiaceae bacterium]
MKSTFAILLASIAVSTAAPIKLFNGEDLTGWTADVPAADKEKDKEDKDRKIAPSFMVVNGMLVSMGKPEGHLVTNQMYSDYTLTVEYRFPAKGGNCGVLVHASTPRALYGMFPQSIEVQMLSGEAGDFWCIQENIEVPDMKLRRPHKEGQKFGGGPDDARNIKNLTDNSENPVGEWNMMVIRCKGDEITVKVNGTLVNHGTRCTATSGKIAIQAEGTPVEFRKIELDKDPEQVK